MKEAKNVLIFNFAFVLKTEDFFQNDFKDEKFKRILNILLYFLLSNEEKYQNNRIINKKQSLQ